MRYPVKLAPGSAAGRDVGLTIKLQRSKPDCPAIPECVPAPTGLFWLGTETGRWSEVTAIGSVEAVSPPGWQTPVPPFLYACRIEGDLCGRDRDVVLDAHWVNSDGGGDDGPCWWSIGNILVVTACPSNGVLQRCKPGVLTVTASLAGVFSDSFPINLIIAASGGYYY